MNGAETKNLQRERKPLERFHDAVSEFKREYLSEMLLAHGGNRTRTARTLGIQRTYLLKLIRELGLRVSHPQMSRHTNRKEFSSKEVQTVF